MKKTKTLYIKRSLYLYGRKQFKKTRQNTQTEIKDAKKNQRRSRNNQKKKSFEKCCNKQPKFLKYPMFALETSKEIRSAKKICREQHPTI